MTIHVTSGNYEEEILDSTEPVLIDFYADWCGPCQMLKPVIEQISEEAEHTKIVNWGIACCSSNNAESRSKFHEGRHGAEA